MQRIVLTSWVAVLAALLAAGTAWAGPDTGPAKPILTKTAKPTTLFGYAGKRPLDASRPSGIARPTPAPRVETAAFGAATDCLPAKPKLVTPSPAPRLAASPSDVIVVRECRDGACSSCTPCDPCGSCCPTSRIDDDPLSVSPHQWSSGYHDGQQVKYRDPCQPRCSQPVYRSPCEPCAEPSDPCATRVVVRRPVRVVRRVSSPCATPCASPCYRPYRPYRPWCGPRVRVGIAPCWGWGLGFGWGWGWGGCW